jgi:uncharacterized protein YbcI
VADEPTTNGALAVGLLNGNGHCGAAGELNAEVARAIVRAYREVRGRGPTKARASFRGDVIVVVLEGVLTRAERSLIAGGRPEEALQLRRNLHAVMRPMLANTIADLTGTVVRAAMGDSEHDPDMAVEVFVLDRPVDPSRYTAHPH